MPQPDELVEVPVPGDGSVKVGQMTAADVTALVTLFSGMLNQMEVRIIARLDQNAAAAVDRWALHEREHANHQHEYVELQNQLADHMAKSAKVWDHYREQELVEDARIEPVKNAANWLWTNWRTILLLVIGIVAVLGFSGETLDRLSHTLFR